MKNNFIIAVTVSLLLGGAVGFYGGIHYQKSQRGNFAFGQGRQFGQFGGRNGGGNRPVVGQIISVDATSMTVKLSDGSSKIVLLSDKTSINKAATASLSDLKTGEQVVAFGTTNADGSVTAQNVQLNPQMRMRSTN